MATAYEIAVDFDATPASGNDFLKNFQSQSTLEQMTAAAQITYAAPIASVSSLHQQLLYGSVSFMGTVYYDASGNALYITPDSGQNVSVKLYNGTTVVLDGSQDLILGQNRILNGGNWTAYGSTVLDRQQMGVQLKLVNSEKNIAYTDPLLLDAGGDGILMSANPVNFDLNADGVTEALPWAAPTDPLLVLDVNRDGRINNGSELIDLTTSGAPLNLLTLDSNGDGKLDSLDAAYWQLQLWSDRNQDGYASAEERQSLADTGITSVNLTPITSPVPIAGKTGVKGVVVTYKDGGTRTLWDVPFDTAAAVAVTNTNTVYTTGIDKITGSGQTALVAKSALGVTLDLTGNSGNDTLTGNAGNNWLMGNLGSDTFNAGAGDDVLLIDAQDLQANIHAGAGEGSMNAAANDEKFEMRRIA